MCPGGVIAPCATRPGEVVDERMVVVEEGAVHGEFGYCCGAAS